MTSESGFSSFFPLESEKEETSQVSRAIPANIQAEKALLGAIFVNNRAYERVQAYLEGRHFAHAVHGEIYDAIARRINGGQLADPITMRAELEHGDILKPVGGFAYVAELVDSMVGIINADSYGKVIHDCWIRRELIDIGEKTVNAAFSSDPEADGEIQLGQAEEALFQLAHSKGQDERCVDFSILLNRVVEEAVEASQRGDQLSGITTGFRDLDRKTGGFHPSDLIILAGRPAMGKTALATKMAYRAARHLEQNAAGKEKRGRVLFFSAEMSAEQLVTRILSDEASIVASELRKGNIREKDLENFIRAARRLEHLPLSINDASTPPLSLIRTYCRKVQRTQGLDLVVVDYLQFIEPAVGTKFQNTVDKTSAISRQLKALAKEMNVPVVALSQLSRRVEEREDKRPMMSDLRDSGSIEQDADMVMFVYRDEYYLKQREPKDTQEDYATALSEWKHKMEKVSYKADLIIEKNRHGATGTIPLYFDGQYTRFDDLDEIHQG
ncbi:replicative DNA helicase [Acetobacteraceae bacterium]|nr:replicative DNA helicase [Acetobacteraceae bacterium]